MRAPLTSATGALGAQDRSRIEFQPAWFDVLFAPQAYAVGSRGQSGERGIDTLNFQLAPLIRGLSHCLRLHGIHSRQTADALLIKRNRLQRVGGLGTKPFHFLAKLAQTLADLIVGITHPIRLNPVRGARHYDLTGWS